MRPFSLKDHPDNVCVFTAASMMEALIAADDAHRRGYDAGIWAHPGAALECPVQARAELEERFGSEPQFAPHFSRAAALTQQYRHERYKMPAPGLERSLERRRFAGLFALRLAFNVVIPEGRAQMSADYAPHVDPEPNPERSPRPDHLFEGEHVKVLRVHNVTGMLGFDHRDHRRFEELGLDEFTRTVHPKWYMQIGDVAFFKGSFLHSAGRFTLQDGETPRVADIQDCTDGIPLKVARSLV